MKHTKILSFLFFLLLAFSAQAQYVEGDLHVGEDEFSRCHTVEYNNYLQAIGKKTSDAQFEKWMQQKVMDLQRQAAQKGIMDIYTIPTIVHVIHRGEAEGTETNISEVHVLDQIEQLNRDFRRITGTLGGFNNTNFVNYADTADILIEFCPALRDPDENPLAQPGVDRVNALTSGLGAGVYTIVEFDDVVKRNTFWNPDEYFNFWSADLGGGVILGYAQFPEAPTLEGIGTGNGDAETDGVVCLYTTIGGEQVPGPNSPFDLGRTGTHEVGHWLGLRHIWGDGDCGADDFCEDTPNAADSNGGCANTTNSCDDSGDPYFGGADPRDMVENYMDYSADACMNLFTNQQRDRMRIVMGETGQGSPRREILNASTKCSPPLPWISFVDESSSIIEGTACGIVAANIPLKIALAPTTSSTVTFSYMGTAMDGTDYQVVNTVTFPAGIRDQQTLTLEIASDAIVEGTEEVVITITAVSGGGQLNATNLTHTLTIEDDDFEPSLAALQNDVDLLNTNFENASDDSDWSIISPIDGANDWIFSAATAASTGNLTRLIHISNTGTTYTYDQLSDTRTIIFQEIDATNTVDLQLTFDWACVGEGADGLFDYGEVVYSLDGINFQRIPGTSALHTQPTMTTTNYSFPSFLENTTFFFGFSWQNDALIGSITAPLAIDNVILTGDQRTAANIKTTQSISADTRFVNANQTVFFYDPTSGEVMAAIENGDLSLGCTTLEVATGFSSPNIDLSDVGNGIEAAAKTFEMIPSTSSTTADYKVWLYYTDAEIQSWINNHGQNVTIEDFAVFKTTASSVSQADDSNTEDGASQQTQEYNATANGYRFSAEFTDGLALFGGANIRLCNFAGDQSFSGLLPIGKTAVENNATVTATTEVNKSYDFSAGNMITLSVGAHIVSNSNAHLYIQGCTNVVPSANQSVPEDEVTDVSVFGKAKLAIYPNPSSGDVSVEFTLEAEETIQVAVYDMRGSLLQMLLPSSLQAKGFHRLQLEGNGLNEGTYYLQVRGETTNVVKRLMIVKD